MKEIKAFIRPECVDPVLHALEDAGFEDLTVIPVQAIGSLIDPAEAKFSTAFLERYSRVSKLELVCRDDAAPRAVDLITRLARTGEPGDGIVYLSEVESVLKIRSGEREGGP